MPANLSKKRLYEELFRSLEMGGCKLLLLSSEDVFPREIVVSFSDGSASRSIVYMWNCTFDRTNDRPRFQVTGVDSHRFIMIPGVQTFLIGYDHLSKVFTVADAAHRKNVFGASPSVYFTEASVNAAREKGLSSYNSPSGETIIAVRSDLLSALFRAPEAIHEIANQKNGSKLLEGLGAAGSPGVPKQRSRVLVSRAVRDARFPGTVLPAYRHACAVCSLQLGLVEAAHIIPVSSGTWDDGIDNGIALCVLHHRAYDSGLILIRGDYSVQLNRAKKRVLAKMSRGGGMTAFETAIRSQINLPANRLHRPSPKKLEAGIDLRGQLK